MLRRTGRSGSSVQLEGQAGPCERGSIYLSCLKLSEISVGGRPREEEQWSEGKGRSKPRGRKMEDLALVQQGSFQGTGNVIWKP